MTVIVRVTQRLIPVSVPELERLLADLLNQTLPLHDVGLHVASASFLRGLNTTYRGKRKATDILSFSGVQWASPEVPATPASADRDLGDLFVSPAVVFRDAARAGLDPSHHMVRIITHGFVHLLGYDHENEEDAAVMAAKESQLRRLLQQDTENPYRVLR